MELGIREMLLDDIEKIVSYFVDADAEYLKGMGADINKLPSKKDWINKLIPEIKKDYPHKEHYYIIWLLDNETVGHSNINHIAFEKSAKMHLHLWIKDNRKRGVGLEFLKMTIPLYFRYFKLHTLICEPFAENKAPNKTMKKLGFDLVQTYNTTPGLINFPQTVNRYELTKERLEELQNATFYTTHTRKG